MYARSSDRRNRPRGGTFVLLSYIDPVRMMKWPREGADGGGGSNEAISQNNTEWAKRCREKTGKLKK